MKDIISYEGKVTIKVKDKPPIKRNNTGTPVLFKMLCDILTTTNISDDKVYPAYMSLIHDDGGTTTPDYLKTQINYSSYAGSALVTSLLPISSRKHKSTTSANSIDTVESCVFTSLIAHSQTNTNNVSNLNTCYVLLLNNKQQIMAFFPITFDSIQSVFTDVNGQAAISWEMFFANKDGEK